MLRFFSRRKVGKGHGDGEGVLSREEEVCCKKRVACRVVLLDGSDLCLMMGKKWTGEELMSVLHSKLDIIERDYFGLQYTDTCKVPQWVDPSKQIRKQVKVGPPYAFRMRIKFYSSEPNNLHEEITRYQFFLQLKQDLFASRLECPYHTAVELSSLSLQSELGDFDPEIHTPSYISEFRFVSNQNEEFEIDVFNHYKKLIGRTEFQNTVSSSRTRRTVSFERRPSQRYARRQSHVLREKESEKIKAIKSKIFKLDVLDTSQSSPSLCSSNSSLESIEEFIPPLKSHKTRDELDFLIKSLQKGVYEMVNIKSECKDSIEMLPNNQSSKAGSKPIPLDHYKNNLLTPRGNNEISLFSDAVSIEGDKIILSLINSKESSQKLINLDSSKELMDSSISVTHFSSSEKKGLEKETLFMDNDSQENYNLEQRWHISPDRLNLIERNSTNYAISKIINDKFNYGNSMDPTPPLLPSIETDIKTINIETSFASNQPVTRSLSSVSSPQQCIYKLPAFNVEKDSPKKECSAFINNDIANKKYSTSSSCSSLDQISPWLVLDNVSCKKKMSPKMNKLRTVITTEL
ncbi:uncharacterized protein [Lepeophtheirus salmonis]|uniref:uncharacterized protein isoform X3 n=1 Tax=Lepeophtheirus salmonis TaxID=72036 RepID=UPI001AE6F25C|nr:uncharacterized protein LOC121127084 isoform X3 [Lepeophtheirus salmonis]